MTEERGWQNFWEKKGLYKAVDGEKKPKKYVLVEFPYPSGSGLHIGHTFSFTGADVYARFKRMQGYNVLFPMGWDAFGLPTENYAIKTKRKPQEVTKENTDKFREQMKRLAFSFDWSREVNTTDPDYYKWTQWIFIKLFEKGLAYKKEMPINWCRSCKIGLANEEVVQGKCERCGGEVERRDIAQWIVKITDYADRLLEGLERTDFVEKVKMAQVNWIGKSEGARVRFRIVGNGLKPFRTSTSTSELEVFTTRPDTLPGVTFMVISPEHEIVESLKFKVESKRRKEIEDYLKATRKKSDLERAELNRDKTGVFSGMMVINPLNGKEIPLWIADYVLMGYGTGVVMGVPAHDERDHAFAKKYNLEIIPVIKRDGWDFEKEPYTDVEKGEEFKRMMNLVEEKGFGKRANSYHLRDWIFSRQHYWGEPIPMIFCEKCGWVPVEEKDLPIKLPEVEHYEPTDTGESPLSKMTEWVKTTCPKCGGEARRETDTMPNWAGSDWYFLRYIDPKNDKCLADREKMEYWMPVDVYVGGDEHNTLHLLYSRFIYKFLYDLGKVPTDEPYFKRMSHGVILGPDGQRMSKSRGNVVIPDEMIDKWGVDVVRVYLMFMGPFEATMAWNEKTLNGVKRFLDKFNKFINEQIKVQSASNNDVKVIINKLISGVTKDMEGFGFNTAVAKMMEGLNKMTNDKYQMSKEEVRTLIKLIAPMAPYTAEELWHELDDEGSVHVSEWPKVEEKYLIEETITIPVAVNGKVREQLRISNDKCQMTNEIIRMARELPKIKPWIEGKKVIKEIYVSGKMVNLVVA